MHTFSHALSRRKGIFGTDISLDKLTTMGALLATTAVAAFSPVSFAHADESTSVGNDPEITLRVNAALRPDAAQSKNASVLVASNAKLLGTTKNGCKAYLENAGTLDSRLVIVKDGKRNEFPTLKEAEKNSVSYFNEINWEIAQSKLSRLASLYTNSTNVLHDEVPKQEYEWRLKAITILAETCFQMNREAMLTGDSSSTSQYLKFYMEGHANKVLSKKLPEGERLQSMIRLAFHAFGDLKFETQTNLEGYFSRSDVKDNLVPFSRKFALKSATCTHFEVIQPAAKKLVTNPEAVGRIFLSNFTTEQQTKEMIQYYKNNKAVGYRNLGGALEGGYDPSKRIAFLQSQNVKTPQPK